MHSTVSVAYTALLCQLCLHTGSIWALYYITLHQVVEPEAIRSARYFSPQDLAQLCLSMARLSYDSEQLLGEIATSARKQLHKFTPRELTILLGAMAKVNETVTSVTETGENIRSVWIVQCKGSMYSCSATLGTA
jgi:hypothetical protein